MTDRRSLGAITFSLVGFLFLVELTSGILQGYYVPLISDLVVHLGIKDADVRIYLDAAPEVRARRRVEQLRAKGIVTDESEVLAQILERDARDSSRRDGPLVCPTGADIVDTSGIDVDEVIDRLESIVRSKAREALPAGASRGIRR